MLAIRLQKRRRRRTTKAEHRALADRVEKSALIGTLLLTYYVAFGGAANQAARIGCALCAIVFAAVSLSMLVFFAFAGRRVSAICWILSFCACSLAFIKLW